MLSKRRVLNMNHRLVFDTNGDVGCDGNRRGLAMQSKWLGSGTTPVTGHADGAKERER